MTAWNNENGLLIVETVSSENAVHKKEYVY